MFESRLISRHRATLALLALLLASLICCALLVARRIAAGEMKFSFLPGNLLLAWIPLIFALIVYELRARRSQRWGVLATCALIWFLFYPNAPYLITDLVHIKTRPPIPRWFDLVLMMSFAWTGLFLGNLSLYLMQEAVRAWRGRAWSWAFAIAMLALGALGVFVGRFWRWNSWQVVTNPFGLAGDAFRRLGKMPAWELGAFCATFFAFSLVTYITLYTLTHLHGYLDSADGKSRLP
jgi:uncharacterized membrane protein